ncbi:MAG: hypothetical protein DSY82_03265 [Flavobacteriia bacterium]|nr:MAG: hypothetical protein DSY82_03265 [Flavobacteriia bacterium]
MKKHYKKGLVVLIILSLLVIIINVFVSRFVEDKIKEVLTKQNNDRSVSSVQTVKFNLLKREINVVGFKNEPTEKLFDILKHGDSIINSLQKISITSFDIIGINFYKLLFKNSVDINKIYAEDISVTKYIYPNSEKSKDSIKKTKPDSISLGKLKGLELGKIEVENLQFQTIDVLSGDTTLRLSLQAVKMGGFKMIKDSNKLFHIEPLDKDLIIKKVIVNFFNKDYILEIDQITRNNTDNIIDIDGLHFKPLKDKVELGKSYKYNKVVFNANVDKIRIFNYQINKLIRYNSYYMDSILFSGMNLDLYKDRRKPFDLKKRPKFLNVLLNEMKDTLRIPKISIQDSKIFFEMVLEKKEVHLKINLYDIDADIKNVISVNAEPDKKLVLNYRSKFMKDAMLKVDLDFPYKDNKELFYMDGSISKSKFKYFDSAIYPTLGIKVLKGDLDGMKFTAVMGPRQATGTMTLLYHDLETEIFKKNSMEQNKFLSWSVNKSLYNSNPVKGKPPRVALINANRFFYKGFINYIWLAAQSGIVNTLTPFGKTVAKAKKKAQKMKAREMRKKKREKKKKNK